MPNPFNNSDYPNPNRSKRHPAYGLSGSDNFLLTRKGTDKFFYEAGRAPEFDYPNPIRVKYYAWRYQWRTNGDFNPPVLARPKFGFPPVVPYMADEKEHRRQIAAKVNQLLLGKMNVSIDVVLNASMTTTTLTDARIGYLSSIIPAMAQTASGAAAIVAGIWVSNVSSGSCTINHASNAATDQQIRFSIIG